MWSNKSSSRARGDAALPADWPFRDLTPHSYGVVVADPPWKFKAYTKDGGLNKGPERHYDCMTLDEIKALPVAKLYQRDAILLLWTTGWAMAEGKAHDVARAWGAKPVSEMIWRKITEKNHRLRWGTGYRVRSQHEPILVCTIGNPKFTAFPSCIDGIVGQHSEKPAEVYEVIRKRTPLLLWRCDLFSAGIERYGFEGWGESHRTVAARTAHAAKVSEALEAGQSARAPAGPPGGRSSSVVFPEVGEQE